MFGSIGLIVVILLLGILFLLQRQNSMEITATNSYNMGTKFREIEYNGKKYQYNNRVTCILYAGVDSTGKLESVARYGNKARADSIALVVMNEITNEMHVLSINRDTMTQIRRYTMNGTDEGLYTTHLGYAFSYGDGGKVSCENLVEAVSLLMGEIPIREYVVTNQDSMPYINDLVGGVTVTVPNSDLEEENPEFAEGAEVTITGENINTFLRYRDTGESFSNEGRMERQKVYTIAYFKKLKEINSSEFEKLWEASEEMNDYLLTSVTKSEYLSLIQTMKKMEFSDENFEQLAGTDQEGELHDEFYPDETLLQEKIIELFYLQKD